MYNTGGIVNFEVNLTNTLNHINKQLQPVHDALKSLTEEKDTTKLALAKITETLELIKQLPEIQKIITESKNKLESDLAAYNQKFLLSPIGDLYLSTRAHNCLKIDNINISIKPLLCVLDLITKTEDEILKVPNLGRVTCYEIKDLLKEYGLRFGMSKEDISVWKTTNQTAPTKVQYVGTYPDEEYVYINPYTREVKDPSEICIGNMDKYERIGTILYLKKEHCNV